MFKEFKEFAFKGNVIDMAVGIIIGAAFTNLVSSLVKNIVMPPIGMLLGKVDFSNLALTIQSAHPGKEAIAIRYGLFINTLVDFLILAFVIFLVVKQVNRLLKKHPNTKNCPLCYSKINIKAIKCPNCTGKIE